MVSFAESTGNIIASIAIGLVATFISVYLIVYESLNRRIRRARADAMVARLDGTVRAGMARDIINIQHGRLGGYSRGAITAAQNAGANIPVTEETELAELTPEGEEIWPVDE